MPHGKAIPKRVKATIKRLNLRGVNKPKRTPRHKSKSHVVMAHFGSSYKLIRFGQQGAKTAGKPKKGESARMKAKRKSFKSRFKRKIAKGPSSAAYWANRVKW